ncbi:phosphoribosylanthranilate isomerase [Parvularcula sp. IMCC14364]|uniref:phosphoribosylanthranilate isomerase n=1 Tax=Parvularcula sp. IMCC14364 TaxID=3067902 RepID=UPI0027420081|nr:phosphoribosylanthranilate isomerase [Parvularcula sp. IMCC14364]
MSFHIKICGLKDAHLVDVAIDAGADMIGLVFFPKSPRHLDAEQAAPVALAARGRAATVGLFVHPSDGMLTETLRQLPLTHLQLHGQETPERVDTLRTQTGKPVIKAIGVSHNRDISASRDFAAAADFLLFDTAKTAVATLPGGNGSAFDWSILTEISGDLPWLLAGGLTPENIAEAILAVKHLPGFAGVDVSSGVESRRGEKDAGLIRAFTSHAKAAFAAPQPKAETHG